MFSIKMLISSARRVRDDLSNKEEIDWSKECEDLNHNNDIGKIVRFKKSNIEKARASLSLLVSRETIKLTRPQIISATIETLTENVVDSVTAPIFYYFLFSLFGVFLILLNPFNIIQTNTLGYYLFGTSISETTTYGIFILFIIISGISGSIFYRVINTLDAMVGYKDKENKEIGYFSAKLDDILNYVPARLTGLFFVVASFILKMNYKNSYKIMKRDARNCPSPNSGFTMAATAGALNVQLEKPDNSPSTPDDNDDNDTNISPSTTSSKTNAYKLGDMITFLETVNIDSAINLSKLAILLTIIFLAAIFSTIISILLIV
ncbi:MAG: cobalamin biosynthesis protein [Methanobacteriaceae archaeon]